MVMKLDVEGAEYTVMPPLLLSGGLCELSEVFAEWHPSMKTPGAYGALHHQGMGHFRSHASQSGWVSMVACAAPETGTGMQIKRRSGQPHAKSPDAR